MPYSLRIRVKRQDRILWHCDNMSERDPLMEYRLPRVYYQHGR